MSAVTSSTLNTWRRQERRFVAMLVILFLLLFIPAIRDARRDARDARRIDDLAQAKRQVEQFYNVHAAFPSTSGTEPLPCVSSDDDTNNFWDSMDEVLRDPVLPREQRWRWFPYVYCPTAVEGNGEDIRVTSFFLQAALEHPRVHGIGFDREEGRNFRFRVIEDGRWTFYRICGGEEPSCTPT